MAFRNVPFRSEVLAWDADSLADYFKKLNYKDCEKAVRKHHIDGPRFLNLAENDIQKFPKLRVPILSKLSQEINKNEERRSIFTRKPQVQRFPEETGKLSGVRVVALGGDRHFVRWSRWRGGEMSLCWAPAIASAHLGPSAETQ
uniref:SAM domain-containing protein n=1 Tax=Sus scrofa TaxID=9823 RepID=A0A8D0Q6K1_PIG